MPKAFIKRRVLPDAPKPTKPVRALDPRDLVKVERALERREIECKKDKPKTRTPYWDAPRVNKLRRLYKEGLPIKEIARQIGCELKPCQSRISKELANGDLQPRQKRLNAEQVRAVIDMRRAGMMYKDIAKHFGVTENAVMKIIHRQRKKEKKND